MCDHSETAYKNSCLKIPSKPHRPSNKNLTHLEREVGKLKLDSSSPTIDNRSTQADSIKSLLEFYDSIPEYDDINHLSNNDFYKKVHALREKQRSFCECLVNTAQYGESVHSSWRDNYKSLNNRRNSIIKSKHDADSLRQHKPPSRRSVRIESPDGKVNEPRPKSRSADVHSRTCKNNDSTLDDLSDCTMTTRSAPCSPRKPPETDDMRTPENFKMTVRDETDKVIEEIIINSNRHKASASKADLFRANPVPIESRIPLFEKIMYEQEKRRQQTKMKSKEALRANMRLFSFTKREEEINDLARRLTKSTPDLLVCYDPQKYSVPQFKAKPVPKNLFSNYVYQKMHEDQYYRTLQKKIRAEEMLKKSSLPPSMAKREKLVEKHHHAVCPKSFREMYESQMKKIPASRRKELEKELAELELDFIMATPSPVCNKPKVKSKKKKTRKASSSSSSKSSQSPSALESVNRSNLAAVLRIQNSRKRMEEEISRRLEDARVKEEARWREKVLRKRPIWQMLAYSHEEDLSMRLQMRRDEERLRNEVHRMQMNTMLGRVNQQPTLFERQSSHAKLYKSREELLTYVYGDNGKDRSGSRCTSTSSIRKCMESKNETTQAHSEQGASASRSDEKQEEGEESSASEEN